MVSLTHILNKNEVSCQVKYAVACTDLQCMYHDYGKQHYIIQDDNLSCRCFFMKQVKKNQCQKKSC